MTRPPATAERGLAGLAADARIIVCCGSGGVGKTTTAAALGLLAARSGRRAVVVTIDPAKRLADAMGLARLSHEPERVALDGYGADGPGELWAMMLDTRATFDGLVRRYAAGDAQVEAIFHNRFYRNIAGALSGTQEYMAVEQLSLLHHDPRFDLVVIDTPPTRAALDFLDAPQRLVRFLEHPLFRFVVAPTRLGMRVANVAAQPVIRTMSKVVGSSVISDAIGFFQAFEGMEQGFAARARDTMELLRSDATRYVVVASPRHDTVAEARWFGRTLEDLGLVVAGVVVNRIHPDFGPAGPDDAPADATDLWANHRELQRVARREAAVVAELFDQRHGTAAARIPLMNDDVHDLAGLAAIAELLAGGGSGWGPPATRG